MAADIAPLHVSGLRVQVCGDAHLVNFGLFASPERSLLFDINDFDETLPGAWEWDLMRLSASLVLASRARSFSAHQARHAVLQAAATYRARMAEYASMRAMDVYLRARRHQCRDGVRGQARQAVPPGHRPCGSPPRFTARAAQDHDRHQRCTTDRGPSAHHQPSSGDRACDGHRGDRQLPRQPPG